MRLGLLAIAALGLGLASASCGGGKGDDSNGSGDGQADGGTIGGGSGGGGGGGDGGGGDGGGGAGGAGEAPAAFTIVRPAGALASSAVELVITRSYGAASYDVRIGADAACSSPLVTLAIDHAASVVEGVLEITKSVDHVFEDGDYFVCATATNAAGTTAAANDGQEFTIDTTAPQSLSSLSVVPGEALGELSIAVSFGAEAGVMSSLYFIAGSGALDCSFATDEPSLRMVPIERQAGVASYQYLWRDFERIGETLSFRVCHRDEAGNVTPGAAAVATVQNRQRVFATSETFSPYLIGDYRGTVGAGNYFDTPFRGANVRCAALAEDAGLRGEWKAILSTSLYDAKTLITAHGPLFNMAGQQLTASKDALWSGLAGAAEVRYDETGELILSGDAKVWTGTTSNGTRASDTCGSWQSTVAGLNGLVGSARATQTGWLDSEVVDCAASHRLLCIEQTR